MTSSKPPYLSWVKTLFVSLLLVLKLARVAKSNIKTRRLEKVGWAINSIAIASWSFAFGLVSYAAKTDFGSASQAQARQAQVQPAQAQQPRGNPDQKVEPDVATKLLKVKRIYVDSFGDDLASKQLQAMVTNALVESKKFIT